MKKSLRKSILGVTFLLGSTALTGTSALAGGLNLHGGMKDTVVYDQGAIPVPAPIPMEETATWYIRGDLGLIGTTHADAFLDRAGGGEGVGNFEIDNTYSLGLGVGYYFSERIRGDLTYDYFAKRDTNQRSVLSASNDGTDIESSVLLSNMYFDFRPTSMISPYLGAGIGAAFHNVKPRALSTYTANDGSSVTVRSTGSGDTREFAVAAMAGVNIALRRGLFLNMGYRYLYTGDVRTNYAMTTVSADGLTTTTEAVDLNINDITSHEFKVGVRYDLY